MIETYVGEAEILPKLCTEQIQELHNTHKYSGEINKLFAKHFNIEPTTNADISGYNTFKILTSNKVNVHMHNTNIRDKEYLDMIIFQRPRLTRKHTFH